MKRWIALRPTGKRWAFASTPIEPLAVYPLVWESSSSGTERYSAMRQEPNGSWVTRRGLADIHAAAYWVMENGQ